MSNTRKLGGEYEKLAATYLQQHGCKVLEQNFRNRSGEIDIIAMDGETLVFVEVKYRKNTDAGSPLSAVDFRKQRQICRVSDFYRMTHGVSEFTSMRFDVIGFLGEEITWMKNAFNYVG